MILPITLVVAAAAGLINLWLALRVSRVRIAGKIMTGDGADAVMTAKMRAHANFAEYAPTILILIGLVELARGTSLWLWLLGVTFVVGRLAHALGMDRPAPNPFRMIGILATWLVLLALSVWAMVIGYDAAAARPATGPVIIGAPPPAA